MCGLDVWRMSRQKGTCIVSRWDLLLVGVYCWFGRAWINYYRRIVPPKLDLFECENWISMYKFRPMAPKVCRINLPVEYPTNYSSSTVVRDSTREWNLRDTPPFTPQQKAEPKTGLRLQRNDERYTMWTDANKSSIYMILKNLHLAGSRVWLKQEGLFSYSERTNRTGVADVVVEKLPPATRHFVILWSVDISKLRWVLTVNKLEMRLLSCYANMGDFK